MNLFRLFVMLIVVTLTGVSCDRSPTAGQGDFPCPDQHDGGFLGNWEGGWGHIPVFTRLALHLEELEPLRHSGRVVGTRFTGTATVGGAGRLDTLVVRNGHALCESGDLFLFFVSTLDPDSRTMVMTGRRRWWEGRTTTHLEVWVEPSAPDLPSRNMTLARPR